MTRLARAERDALCDTLLDVGPDRPTLCEGWLTRDLAAHLVVRERRPDAQPGIWIPAFAGHTESVQRELADRPWPELVAAVRQGPPAWNPMRIALVDELTNTAEFFVHHEDVRRAQPGWQPRVLHPELERALWKVCTGLGRLKLRSRRIGVELVAPGIGRTTASGGHPTVRIEGPPAELVLFLFGRRSVAQVELDGPNDAVEQVRRAG